MRHTKILVALAGVLTCAVFQSGLAQAGDVYKFVDDHGTTLYTDKPIPGAVLVSTGSQRPAEVAQRNYAASQAATQVALADGGTNATSANTPTARRKTRCSVRSPASAGAATMPRPTKA